MTAPEPHSPRPSRRAARRQRERDAERALGMPPAAASRRTRRAAGAATTSTGPIRVGAARVPVPPTRHEARTAQLMDPATPPARHAQRTQRARAGVVAGLAVAVSLVLGSTASVTAAITGEGSRPSSAGTTSAVFSLRPLGAEAAPEPARTQHPPTPAAAETIPTPMLAKAPEAADLCSLPGFADALATGNDAAVIAAAGGAEAFRRSIAAAMAPCVSLDDPARVWVVINKARPIAPVDHRPASLTMPADVRSTEGGSLRTDAAAALTAMAAAAAAAGVGEIALESGFRSYATQVDSYGNQVAARGVELADLSSARPGFSEHQSGLAADVVPCAGGCGTLDDLAAAAQGQWIAEHAWEFGWITRYEDGLTPITGYAPEPWHLRYIGTDLARAYHDGGWRSLEEFFGLPAAPGYVG